MKLVLFMLAFAFLPPSSAQADQAANRSEELEETVLCLRTDQGRTADLSTLIDGCRDIDFDDIEVLSQTECRLQRLRFKSVVRYTCVTHKSQK